MTRRMSCALTTDAVRDRSKTVTRRHVDTWKNLKPGDRLTIVEKAMGLPKGAKQVVLAEVEVTDVRVEAIGLIHGMFVDFGRHEEMAREGLPLMTPLEFVEMWLRTHGYADRLTSTGRGATPCRRIEWRYL